MLCPSCGKKTIFDWERCPACGVDPWTKPSDVMAAGRGGARADAGEGVLQRVLRIYTARPKLSFVFLLLGTLQIAVACGASLWSARPASWLSGDNLLLSILDWLWGLGVSVVPGLALLAVAEVLVYLAAIRDDLKRGR